MWWHTVTHGRGSEGETGEWSVWPILFTLPRNMVYPALLPLMRTTPLPVVDWTDASADLNGLVRFAERRNLVSVRVPSHFKRSLQTEALRHSAAQIRLTSHSNPALTADTPLGCSTNTRLGNANLGCKTGDCPENIRTSFLLPSDWASQSSRLGVKTANRSICERMFAECLFNFLHFIGQP